MQNLHILTNQSLEQTL